MAHRQLLGALALSGLVAIPGSLTADWVHLHGGRHLRGVDLEKRGSGYLFTLENGEVVHIATKDIFYVEKSPRDEKVEFRGKQVSLRDKIKTLTNERRERDRRMVRVVEKVARGGKDGEAADRELTAIPADERVRYLGLALSASRSSDARELAARRLGSASPALAEDAKRRAAFSLARAAVKDEYRRIRYRSLASLQELDHPDTALFFTPALRSASPTERTRAANAIAAFPDRRAADALVETLYMAWTGFGRGFVMQATQRAYVADYELVSGGTGFSIIEVADPIVRTATTGAVLDVDVRRVELRARLGALEKITGENFGRDVRRWRQWLGANPAE